MTVNKCSLHGNNMSINIPQGSEKCKKHSQKRMCVFRTIPCSIHPSFGESRGFLDKTIAYSGRSKVSDVEIEILEKLHQEGENGIV